MQHTLGISDSDWQHTPVTVQSVLLSLAADCHAFKLRIHSYQQQLAALTPEVTDRERERLTQTAEIERLKHEVYKLRERLSQNSSNSSLPPSSDWPCQKRTNKAESSGRSQGAQTGHPGVGRCLLDVIKVDKVVELRPASCSRCGCRVLDEDWLFPARRQVVEIAAAGIVVTEYQRFALRCLACGKRNRLAWPEEAAGGAFGARAQAVIAYLTGRLHLSHRDTVEAIGELFGIKIGLGSIAAVQKRISRALARPVAEIAEFVQQQPIAYVDETSWSEKDKRPWLWVSATQQAIVFRILTGRKRTDAQTIIDENATSIVTTDRYPGYNYLEPHHRQICWAHLKRDFLAIAERDGDSKEVGDRLLEQTKRMFELWCKVRDGTMTKTAFQKAIEPIKQRVKQLLIAGTASSHLKTSNTCRNILKLESSLWTFSHVEAVESTNNQAERALRRAVLWRRKSFGTQSEAGSRFVERILTVVQTLRQQGRSVLEFLMKFVVRAGTASAVWLSSEPLTTHTGVYVLLATC